MARYSVATSKDKLSSLIDSALAGEQVIITRHGKPTVELRTVKNSTDKAASSGADWAAWLRTRLVRAPTVNDGISDLVRAMRDESAH